jgi:hypothetical protein
MGANNYWLLATARQPVYTLSNLGTLQRLYVTERLLPFPSTARKVGAKNGVPVEAIILFVYRSGLTLVSLGLVSSVQYCMRIF